MQGLHKLKHGSVTKQQALTTDHRDQGGLVSCLGNRKWSLWLRADEFGGCDPGSLWFRMTIMPWEGVWASLIGSYFFS